MVHRLLAILLVGCATTEVARPPAPAPPVRIEESSTFRPGPVEASDAEVDARVGALTSAWTASSPIDGDLASIPRLRWPARRGRCYRAAIVVLAPGSILGIPARIHLDTIGDDDDPIDDDEAPSTEADLARLYETTHRAIGIGDRSICPTKDGMIELAFVQNGAKTTGAGTGSFRARIYDAPIAEAKLRELERERAEEDGRALCVDCMRERLACQKTGEMGDYKTCEQQFRACLGPTPPACQP